MDEYIGRYRRRNIDIPIPPKYRVNIPAILPPVVSHFCAVFLNSAKYRYRRRIPVTDAFDNAKSSLTVRPRLYTFFRDSRVNGSGEAPA